MSPRSQLRIEIFKFILEAARLVINGAQIIEGHAVRLKISLIAKIHGEQSTYGW